MLGILQQLLKENVLNMADFYFAQFIANKQSDSLPEPTKNLAILVAALASFSQQQGNTCLFLDEELEHNFFGLNNYKNETFAQLQKALESAIGNLPVSQWQQTLSQHNAFTDDPSKVIAPLVFQFNALYFYRTWAEEFTVAKYIKSAVLKSAVFQQKITPQEIETISKITQEKTLNIGQKQAISTALAQNFCLISGGPGTGKTYVVAHLLVALQKMQQQKQQKPLKIRLVAPTGKAADRLEESISNAISKMVLDEELQKNIPTEGMTIHRLLGGRYFRFNEKNPLPIDVLVVDEASMIDLSIMASLLKALKPTTKLILLGDKDQLASVEAGAILVELAQFLSFNYSPFMADLLAQTTNNKPEQKAQSSHILRDHLTHLTESRRFTADSDIGHLALAVNEKQAHQSIEQLKNSENLHWINFEQFENSHSAVSKNTVLSAEERVVNKAVEEYQSYLQLVKHRQQEIQNLENYQPTQEHIKEIFQDFKKVRLLCALRLGDLGVENLNQKIAEGLRRKGLVNFKFSRDWYQGKPIIVVKNDVNVGLFNGNIGLFIGNKVWFENTEILLKEGKKNPSANL